MPTKLSPSLACNDTAHYSRGIIRAMAQRRNFFAHTLGLLALVLFGCATPPAPRTPIAPTTPALALTLWHTQTGVPAQTLNAFLADFHTAFPNLTIRTEQKNSDGDLRKELLARLALNDPPDLVLADYRTLAEFARRNALVNLNALIDENERNDFLPGLLDLGRVPQLENQLCALPFNVRASVLYYNADALQIAKADVPRTWDEFGNLVRTAPRGNSRGWVMLPNATVFASMMYSRGGNILNEVQTQAQFGDDAGLKTLTQIIALSNSDVAYLANTAESARNDFAQGKAIFYFGMTDELTAINDGVARGAKFRWGVANVPQSEPSRPVTAAMGDAIGIFKTNAERERASSLLVQWLAQPAQAARWARETLAIPVRASALNLLATNVPSQLQRLREGYGDAIPLMRPLPALQDANLIDATLIDLWVSAAKGADPATALKNATARVNRILGQIP